MRTVFFLSSHSITVNGKKERKNCFVKCRTLDLFSIRLQLRWSLLIYLVFSECRINNKIPCICEKPCHLCEKVEAVGELSGVIFLPLGQHFFPAGNAVGSGAAQVLSAWQELWAQQSSAVLQQFAVRAVGWSQCLSLSYFSGTGPDQYCILSALSKPSREGNHSGAELCTFWSRSIPWQC